MLLDIILAVARGDPVAIAKAIEDIVVTAMGGYSQLFATAIEILTTGFTMLADDIKDLGRFDRLHHWQYGLITLIAGLIILLVALFMSVSNAQPQST